MPSSPTLPASSGTSRAVVTSVRNALKGELPERYALPRMNEFHYRVQDELAPGMAVLDVGSGRRPAVAPEHRPEGLTYVGLDLSASELAAAPPGSYTRSVVSDVRDPVDELRGQFDLALSWQVFEHVRPLEQAFENLRSYLRPGGRLLTQFSGAFSVFAVADKLFPERLRRWILLNQFHRDPGTVFPAWFDRCWYSALDRIMAPWTSFEVVPLYVGARYLTRSRLLTAAYIGYEEWTVARDVRNLASYYEVRATR